MYRKALWRIHHRCHFRFNADGITPAEGPKNISFDSETSVYFSRLNIRDTTPDLPDEGFRPVRAGCGHGAPLAGRTSDRPPQRQDSSAIRAGIRIHPAAGKARDLKRENAKFK